MTQWVGHFKVVTQVQWEAAFMVRVSNCFLLFVFLIDRLNNIILYLPFYD